MPIIKEDKMHKYDSSSINFKSVKGEVSDAMQFDWKRDKVDDAKKRAIHAAHSYDDFKQRVATCTLKPIHRDEFNKPPKYVFNTNTSAGAAGARGYAAGAAAAPAAPALPSSLSSGSGAEQRLPRTAHEFDRSFRRLRSADDRVALLARLDGDALARLFGRELDAELLRQALVAFDDAAAGGSEDAAAASRLFLSALAARCPASSTRASSFFGSEERELVTRILVRARPAGDDADDDVRICAVLGLPPSAVAAAVAAAAAAAPAPAPGRVAAAEVAPAPAEPAAGPATQAESAAAAAAAEPGASPAGTCDDMD